MSDACAPYNVLDLEGVRCFSLPPRPPAYWSIQRNDHKQRGTVDDVPGYGPASSQAGRRSWGFLN